MLRILVALIAFWLLAGCASIEPLSSEKWDVYTGVNFTPAPEPADEVKLNGPLGVFGVSYSASERTRFFCEHQSSLSDAEAGYGLNGCGFLLKLN